MKKITLVLLALLILVTACKKDEVYSGGRYIVQDGKLLNTDSASYYNDCVLSNAVTDVDGNTYNAVRLGSQVWMVENVRTTKYADGTNIDLGSSTSTTTAYRYTPNGNSNNVKTYGYLYNWKAVMRNYSSSSSNPSGVQGICPNGWHVPSDAEWTQLVDYVISQSQYSSWNIAKSLASTSGWKSTSSNTYAIGYDPSTNNATHFSAVPAGMYSGIYDGFGSEAYFWSTTENSYNNPIIRYLSYEHEYITISSNPSYKKYGFSVRCVKDFDN